MKLWKVAVTSAVLFNATNLCAQQYNDAAPVAFGSFDFIPTVDVGFRYDDNVTRQLDNEISSFSQIISPQFLLLNNFGASQVRFGYRLRNERFYSSSADNYTDHFFTSAVEYELNIRHRFDVGFEFEDGHQQRGTGFSILNDIDAPDTYKTTSFNMNYSYGAPGAKGRLDVNVNLNGQDFDNDQFVGFARDRNNFTVGGTFFYRVGTTTDLTFDIISTSVDYNEAFDVANTLDSAVTSYLVGLSWEATAQTSGFFKVGYEEKDFDSSLREDFDGFDWSAGITWEPTDNAQVILTTGSRTDETNGEGNFILAKNYRLEWRHDWLERVRTSVSFNLAEDEYEGQPVGFSVREDDQEQINLSLFYQFRRWFNVEVGYSRDSRDSNRATVEYDRNQFLINAVITL